MESPDLEDKIEFRSLRHITCAWGSGDRVHEGGSLGYEAGNESAGGIDGTEAAGGGEPTAAAATAADKSAGGLIAVMASFDRDLGKSDAGRPAERPPTLRPWSPRALKKSRDPNAPKFAPFCDSDHRQSSKFKESTSAMFRSQSSLARDDLEVVLLPA